MIGRVAAQQRKTDVCPLRMSDVGQMILRGCFQYIIDGVLGVLNKTVPVEPTLM